MKVFSIQNIRSISSIDCFDSTFWKFTLSHHLYLNHVDVWLSSGGIRRKTEVHIDREYFRVFF